MKYSDFAEVTRVRIPREEKKLLDQYAKEHKLTVSEILRKGYRQIIYERILDDEDAGNIHKTYRL